MTSPERPGVDRERVLVLAPTGRDLDLSRKLLARAELASEPCSSPEDLAQKLKEGAGAALIAEEALTSGSLVALQRAVAAQPAWSDFPFIVFVRRRDPADGEDRTEKITRVLGNVTLLDRPVHVHTMVAAVRAALRARRRQYEAQRAIESRDQFLAMLGHELRNPLGALSLATEIMNRDASKIPVELPVIDRQVAHLMRLVDDLLDVARVATGKIALDRVVLDLTDVVLGAVESAADGARAQGIELAVDLSDDALFVEGDRVRLDQVLGNLLTNGIKYTPRGGRVVVETEARAGRAILRVRDTGIGIEPEMVDRVFDLFAQSDKSLARARGGMGIGLTLVQNLVRLQGGNVAVQSEGLGRGSQFVVSLPLVAPPEQVVSEPVARTRSDFPSVCRVVVVEDNDDIRGGLEELLEAAGYSVSSAADGIEGVKRIAETHADVALVDIGLPGLNGYEVARQVRAARGDGVLLIALTGYGQPEDRERALGAGFDAHLTKPVKIERLEEMLAKCHPAPAP